MLENILKKSVKKGISIVSAGAIFLSGIGAGGCVNYHSKSVPVIEEIVSGYEEVPENIEEPIEFEEEGLDMKDFLDKDYLIVGPEHFLENKTLKEYVKHRENEGFKIGLADIEKVDEFYASEVTGSLKNFIGEVSSSGSLKYVLLVGKRDNVPASYFYNDSQRKGFGDNAFANLEGDVVPEIAIGRIPSENEEELENSLEKIISFEQSNSWENYENVFVAAADRNVLWDGYGFDEIFEDLIIPLVPLEQNVTRLYEQDSPIIFANSQKLTADLVNKINEGVFLVAYAGHGLESEWGNTNFYESNFNLENINSLENQVYPIFYSSGCLTNAYSEGEEDNFGEALVNSEKGGVAYFGASSQTGGSQYLTEGFFSALYGENDLNRIGDIIVYAKNFARDNEPWGWNNWNKHAYEFNLLGDPTLKIK